ncbi:roadblock/LC7 domain-containing protein [Nocardia sp. NEAU-351]|uniref:Roadblock/LC7 domain-containing protein n=2 Tax=Nocardia bovistercoris TaxID=2785916 RepID=A0A931I993_9NOCA|nr:roadblock/LC7 domain-containing protein [Nocardia bovistercoris]MBH0776248.1 roadblock/LC7 domain-containing protein [Nocardia bovistercoris]
MGRLTKVAVVSDPDPNAVVLAELKALRDRVPQMTGALVASSDGLLIAHDLPAHIEPNGMAALSASQLSLSYRLATTAHGGGFHEVVVRGTEGHVVVYAAGWTSLTVLAGPEANVGRLHLESRPVARTIAEHLSAVADGKDQISDTDG